MIPSTPTGRNKGGYYSQELLEESDVHNHAPVHSSSGSSGNCIISRGCAVTLYPGIIKQLCQTGASGSSHGPHTSASQSSSGAIFTIGHGADEEASSSQDDEDDHRHKDGDEDDHEREASYLSSEALSLSSCSKCEAWDKEEKKKNRKKGQRQ